MTRHVEVRTGQYHDSVRLMQVSRELAERDDVRVALVAMGTPLNLDLLASMGFDLPTAGPNDLLVAIEGDAVPDALAAVDALLAAPPRRSGTLDAARPAPTTGTALRGSDAALVLVSVPGPSAYVEAMDALTAERDVMLFSDNVPVEQETALKATARDSGRLVMGPDCGTAIVQGVGLGFANAVRPGRVGLVAASGTGAQQLSCLLDAAGVGVSHLLGVGGRDLSAAVGGSSARRALQVLDADPGTELIVLVSKPAAPEVAERLATVAGELTTPVQFALLGAGQPDLTAAAEDVLATLGVAVPEWPVRQPASVRKAVPDGRLLGLFAGGTLAAEALTLLAPLGAVRSNLGGDLTPAEILDGAPDGHLVVDFGDDALTAGRAHPMIDPALRLAALHRWAPGSGVVLLDVVLGYGADPDPAASLAPVLADLAVPVVVSLCGTEADPQGWSRQADALSAAGAEVYLSNAAAVRRALTLLGATTPDAFARQRAAPDADSSGLRGPVTGKGATGEDGGGRLLTEPLSVVAVGASLFADSLRAQACPVTEVAWRPPPDADPADIAAVAADPRRTEANAEALRRVLAAGAELVDVVPATALGLPDRTFLHAGPPIDWDRASGPLRGALIGVVLLEGLADDVNEAERLLAEGAVHLEPCHHHRTVGPMAGVVSPSMWLFELRDPVHGGTAYCSLNEGLGKVLRYGAYGSEVLDRLRWMSATLGPALQRAVREHGPVDIKAIVAQMLQMGDEGHNRNRAGTLMLLRELLPELVDGPDAAAVTRFVAGNDHFFLNLVMPAAKLALDAARDIPGSTMVAAMARNGTDFGIQVSGTGDTWFTGPAQVPDGLYLGDYGPADANPDIGDSAITETVGLGGFSMAAAPAIVRFVGGDVPLALETTRSMYDVTLGENPAYAIPILDFRGAPTGIDVLAVARTGILPQINTGMAGRVAGTGQVGAGLVKPPPECFTAALRALAAAVP